MTDQPRGLSDRIEALDVLRGVALCGLVPINILDFAYSQDHFMSPMEVDPGQHWLWYLLSILGMGKFVSLFSMLFGLGILLSTERADASNQPVTGRYMKRLGVLFIFGMLHAYLIWYGDILVAYALIGFLAFWGRRWSAKVQFLVGGIVYLVFPTVVFLGGLLIRWAEFDVGSIAASADDPFSVWLVESYRSGWLEQMPARAVMAFLVQLFGIPFVAFWLSGGLMLLGMASYKAGFFRGAWSAARYRLIAIAALICGTVLGGANRWIGFSQEWEIGALLLAAPLECIATLFLATGYAAAVFLWSFRTQHRFLWNPLRSVGRMAVLSKNSGRLYRYSYI